MNQQFNNAIIPNAFAANQILGIMNAYLQQHDAAVLPPSNPHSYFPKALRALFGNAQLPAPPNQGAGPGLALPPNYVPLLITTQLGAPGFDPGATMQFATPLASLPVAAAQSLVGPLPPSGSLLSSQYTSVLVNAIGHFPGLANLFALTFTPSLGQATIGSISHLTLPASVFSRLPGLGGFGDLSPPEYWLAQMQLLYSLLSPNPPAVSWTFKNREVVKYLISQNDLTSIALYIYTLTSLSFALFGPAFTIKFRIQVVSLSLRTNQTASNYDPDDPASRSVAFHSLRIGQPVGALQPSTLADFFGYTPQQIARELWNAISAYILDNAQNYDYVPSQELFCIRGVDFLLMPAPGANFSALPLPIRNSLNPHNLPYGLASHSTGALSAAALSTVGHQLKTVLQRLYAHALPTQLDVYTAKLSALPSGYDSSQGLPGRCVLFSAVCYALLMHNSALYSPILDPMPSGNHKTKRVKLLKQYKDHATSLCNLILGKAPAHIKTSYQLGSVYEILSLLCSDQDILLNSFRLVLFQKFNPHTPAIYISCVGDDAGGLKVLPFDPLTVPGNTPVLCVYKAHSFLTTIEKLLICSTEVMGGSRAKIRLFERRIVKFPIFQLKQIQPYKFEEGRAPGFNKEIKGSVIPGYHTVDGTICITFDCETGICSHCTEHTGLSVHHPVVACLGFSTTAGKAFVGFECWARKQPGCITSMLEYLSETYNPDTIGTVNVNIAAHYGSKFDFMFITQALLNLGWQFNMLNTGRKLIMITLGSLKFMDSYNLYSGSLGSVYESFLKSPTRRLIFSDAELPKIGKYKGFPYLLLGDAYMNSPTPVLGSVLKDPKIWGDPSANQAYADEKLAYWKQYIQPDYDPDQPLDLSSIAVDYCMQDVYCLSLIWTLHSRFAAFSVYNGIQANTISAPTASSHAMAVFRTCFLKTEAVVSCDFNQPIGLSLGPSASDSTPLTIGQVIRFSAHGALVINHERYRGFSPVSSEYDLPPSSPLRKKFINVYDINSSYPNSMQNEQPTHLQEFHTYTAPVAYNPTLYNRTTILICSVDLTPIMHLTSGVLNIPVNSASISLQTIPHCYYDLAAKTYKATCIWSHMLDYYHEKGAAIKVYAYVAFSSEPWMRDGMKELYNLRLNAKGIDTNTMLPSAAYTVDKFQQTAIKNILNSVYGKTGQKQQSEHVIINSDDQLIELVGKDTSVSDLEVIPLPSHDILKASVVSARPHIGLLLPTASCILSDARLTLTKRIFELESLTALDGRPLTVVCGDTDSLTIPQFLPSPASDQWMKDNIDPNLLGYLKNEEKSGEEVLSPGKKLYCVVSDELDADGKPVCYGASKGVPKGSLSAEDFRKMVFQNQTITVPLKTSFVTRIHQVHQSSAMSRAIRVFNDSRCWPQGSLISRPWADLSEYYSHVSPLAEIPSVFTYVENSE